MFGKRDFLSKYTCFKNKTIIGIKNFFSDAILLEFIFKEKVKNVMVIIGINTNKIFIFKYS